MRSYRCCAVILHPYLAGRLYGTHVDPTTQLPRMVDVYDKDTTCREASATCRVIFPAAVLKAIIAASSNVKNIKLNVDDSLKSTASEVLNDTATIRTPLQQLERFFQEEDASFDHPIDISGADVGDFSWTKGPVLATAVIAGTMAVKSTPQLIPFCHPIPIEACTFAFCWRKPQSSKKNIDSRDEQLCTSTWHEVALDISCTVRTSYKTGVEMEAMTGATVAGLTVYDMTKGVTGAQAEGLRLGGTRLLLKRGGKSDVGVEKR